VYDSIGFADTEGPGDDVQAALAARTVSLLHTSAGAREPGPAARDYAGKQWNRECTVEELERAFYEALADRPVCD